MRIQLYHLFISIFLGSVSVLAQGTFVHEDSNNVTSETYDIKGKVIAKSRVYFDALGKQIQSQSWDVKTKKVWATQTVYDEQGRPALSTSLAPIGANFGYKSDFIRNASGSIFTIADLGTLDIDPSPVASTPNTVGAYFSTKNTTEPYQDITDRPYSRTFYDELNPGKALGEVGGNKIPNDGYSILDNYPQGFSHTMPAAQELFYAFGKEEFLKITNSSYDQISTSKILKTVSIDAHGVETVSFSTQEGQLLASARSGEGPKKQVTSLIGEEGYVDIHVPKGGNGTIDYIGSSDLYEVFDLRTGKKVKYISYLYPGVYRISVMDTQQTFSNLTTIASNGSISIFPVTNAVSRGVIYTTNYYDYSLNYYDDAGNLKNTLPPIGFDNKAYANYNLAGVVTHIKDSLKSNFAYNSLGQPLYTKSPDGGESWFKYRKDGQIRFSQDSKQKQNKEFSYTNYDGLGRAVESGVYKETSTYIFTRNLDTIIDRTYTYEQYIQDADHLKNTSCKEQHFTLYDIADDAGLKAAFGSDPRASRYAHQNYVAGALSKSFTQKPETSTTWYSYDIYGRVVWMVQEIAGLNGLKTIDYEYDDITNNITKVYYQKGVAEEEFIHRYSYDPDDYSLVKVETATADAGPYTEHATYSYYETGALKRINLAEGLQGIDYVYNLNGSLKAINHPSLDPAKDPGGDANDVFGMILDYYKGDYKRPGIHMSSTNVGWPQYNGNIKAVRWNNKGADADISTEKAYVYEYDRNNWLTSATYGHNSHSVTNGISAFTKDSRNDYAVKGITYDSNGNIQRLFRNKHTENGNNSMDSLYYSYKDDKPNQLVRVKDDILGSTNANDIKTQGLNNYSYNAIGQLIENKEEEVTYKYNAAGLVTEAKGPSYTARFFYNDRGQRVKKETYFSDETPQLFLTHLYIRDAAGIPMAIHTLLSNGDLHAKENTIYGHKRLGTYRTVSWSADPIIDYEITDHLGNVRAVIQRGVDDHPKAGIDYYPFGMAMPNRSLNPRSYRYAYQGQENDFETGKEAFDLRLWDGRIGRWLTTDPAGQYASPYLGMGNNPISRIDPDGGTDIESSDSTDSSSQGTYNLSTSFGDDDYSVSYWEVFGEYWSLRRNQIDDIATNAVDYYIEQDIPFLSTLGGTLASTLTFDNQINTYLTLGTGGVGTQGIKGALSFTGGYLGKFLSLNIFKGGSTFNTFKKVNGGTQTLARVSTSTGSQRISTEFHHVFIPQRWQKHHNLPNWLVNNRINVWKLNSVQHSLIDPQRFQFLNKSFKSDVGFFGKYNWFTNF